MPEHIDGNLKQLSGAALEPAVGVLLGNAHAAVAQRLGGPLGPVSHQKPIDTTILFTPSDLHLNIDAIKPVYKLTRKQAQLLETIALRDYWHMGAFPVMHPAYTADAQDPGTSGTIGAGSLYSGGIAPVGDLVDEGTYKPDVEKWWITNWEASPKLAVAPDKATRLRVRFTVDAQVALGAGTGAKQSTVYAIATLFSAPDEASELTNSPSGYPINQTGPFSLSTLGGSIDVLGEFTARAGQRPRLTLVLCLAVGIASGEVNVLVTSNISARRYAPTEGYSAEDIGRFEYQYA